LLLARIIPFVFVLFVIAVLDRNNVGLAALTMNTELAISSQQYGFIVGIFFVGYFIFEIPSNLLLHKLGARVWIARILITWGIVAMLGGPSTDDVSQKIVFIKDFEGNRRRLRF
jgi:MFS transporter, ACS family, tartrate transporter